MIDVSSQDLVTPRLREQWPKFWPERDPERMYEEARERVEWAVDEWGLIVSEQVIDRGWVSITLRCKRRETGEAVFLKVCPPHPEASNEAILAKRFREIFVPAITSAHEGSVLLLEAADPGDHLEDLPIRERTRVAASLSRELAAEDPPEGMTPYDEMLEMAPSSVYEELARDHSNRTVLEFAQEAALELRSREMVLGHGDLHFENILSHKGRWRMIDGKGVIAPLATECTAIVLHEGEPLELAEIWAVTAGVPITDLWLGLAARHLHHINGLSLVISSDLEWARGLVDSIRAARDHC